jgi:hypothetical protein
MEELQPVVQLFRENRGASITHWGDAEYQRLESLAQRAVSSSNAFIYGVKHPDYKDIICGALFWLVIEELPFIFWEQCSW